MDGDANIGSAAGLTQGERLLLWSVRAWVSGQAFRQLVAREYVRLFTPAEAASALRALELALAAIARHARRTIVHNPPCCSRVAADERAMLAIFAAAQDERMEMALRHAEWLVRPSGAAPVVTAAAALALVMVENDLMLPYPGAEPDAAARAGAPARVARLHH